MESADYAADAQGDISVTSTMSLTAPVAPDPTEARFTKQMDDKQQKIAAEIEHKAADAIADIRKTLVEDKLALDATTTAQVEKELSIAAGYMSEGSISLGRGEFSFAREQFTAALETAVRLQALLKVQSHFEQNVISPLLNVETTDSGESVVEINVDLPLLVVPELKITL